MQRYFTYLLSLISITLVIPSCYSYRQHKEKSYIYPVIEESKPSFTEAFVLNATKFPNEFQALKKANFYAISNDSTCATKITLFPLEQSYQTLCMTGPMTAMIVTLGQLPIRLPENYIFKFEETTVNGHKSFSYETTIDKRLWFWDIFSIKKNKNKAVGKSLLKLPTNRKS